MFSGVGVGRFVLLPTSYAACRSKKKYQATIYSKA
jgi:hypothetical protein